MDAVLVQEQRLPGAEPVVRTADQVMEGAFGDVDDLVLPVVVDIEVVRSLGVVAVEGVGEGIYSAQGEFRVVGLWQETASLKGAAVPIVSRPLRKKQGRFALEW